MNMNMNNMLKFCCVLLLAVVQAACRTTTPSFYSAETECLGVEMDGSQTLKTWGKGKNRFDAEEQALKNAVSDVIFKGNFKGSRDCNIRPLITEVNAREKYESYFNAFFRDGGEYKNFVNLKDERLAREVPVRSVEARNRDQSTVSAVVRVLRVELKEKLEKDGILKQ
jgi:hypothetical protein